MFYTVGILFLIFYSIPSIRTVSLRIDGLIDLGPHWSYEYRVLSPRDAETKRDNEGQLPLETQPKYYFNDEERLREDEERLRKAEESLRYEADLLRKAQMETRHTTDSHNHHQIKPESYQYHQPHIEFHRYHKDEEKVNEPSGHRNQKKKKSHKRHRSSHKTEEKHSKPKASEVPELLVTEVPVISLPEQSKNYFSEIVIQNMPKFNSETGPEHEKSVEVKQVKTRTTSTSAKPSTWSSASDEDSSSDSSSTKKAGTMFNMDDFTTTRKPRTPPKVEEESLKKKAHEEDVDTDINDDIVVLGDVNIKTYHGPVNGENNTSDTTTNITTTTTDVLTNTTTTTTEVTTVRTEDIYNNPHKVKDDEKINEFANHICKQTLKVFDAIKQQISEFNLKIQVDVIAKSYEHKFKEFLRETSNQKIKTRLGTQKVILNTIDMSNLIIKRLINYMFGEMDKKGTLRHSAATANIFQKEVDKEQRLELNHACKKFGICRLGSGFPEFLTDIFTTVLKCDDRKFKQTIDAVTEVVGNTDFDRALDYRTEKKLKSSMKKVEQLDNKTLRPLFVILRNIVMNKNKPLIITSSVAGNQINSTLAFLEIIDLLDQNMPRNEANNLEWNDIKTSLKDYSESKRHDVQDIMETLIKLFKKTLMSLDSSNQKIISKNINVLLD